MDFGDDWVPPVYERPCPSCGAICLSTDGNFECFDCGKFSEVV